MSKIFERATEALRNAESLLEAPEPADWRLGLVGLFGIVIYGMSAGAYQGGERFLWAGLKAPLVIAGTLVLCLPSLFVFSSLRGAQVSGSWTAQALYILLARLGFLLLGFMPISWLFAVSSQWLGTAVWVHLFVWTIALFAAARFLFHGERTAGMGFLWACLVWAVSLQVETNLRPLLYRSSTAPQWAEERRSFVDHFNRTLAGDGEKYRPRDGRGRVIGE